MAISGYTGGLYVQSGGTTTLVDTIVAGNTSPTSTSDISGSGKVSGSNNLIGPSGSGGLTNGANGNIVLTSLANLDLSPLGFFGGPTETMALLPGTAAIGKGAAASGVTTDQRGLARGPAIDIGAFQTDVALVVNTAIDGNATNSGSMTLREAVNLANAMGGAATISFAPTEFTSDQTMSLTQGQLELSDTSGTQTITGPAAGLTISAGGNSRVLQADANVTAVISDRPSLAARRPASAADWPTTARPRSPTSRSVPTRPSTRPVC